MLTKNLQKARFLLSREVRTFARIVLNMDMEWGHHGLRFT